MIALATDEGVVLCDFVDRRDIDDVISRISSNAADVLDIVHPHLKQVARELNQYFAGARKTFDVPLAMAGTGFQIQVWKYLQTIPYAQTRSYGQQAREMEQPAAVRAVARANGQNFIAILVPCHRVIGTSGELTGYGGGIERKRWLLDHEQGSLFSAAPTSVGAATR